MVARVPPRAGLGPVRGPESADGEGLRAGDGASVFSAASQCVTSFLSLRFHLSNPLVGGGAAWWLFCPTDPGGLGVFQLLDLFIQWDWSTYLADYGQPSCKYLRVSPVTALALLEK